MTVKINRQKEQQTVKLMAGAQNNLGLFISFQQLNNFTPQDFISPLQQNTQRPSLEWLTNSNIYQKI
jgi:hypothetical protein